jgi:outer membrane immunogenic protein
MTRSFALLLPLAATSVLIATPAAAQDSDRYFNGPYISATIGGAFGDANNNDTVVFDTNRDGRFGDPVLTSGGANAFAPGFCGGRSLAATPGSCEDDDDGIEYSARIVGGVVFEVSKANARDYVTAFSSTPAGYTLSRELDVALSARARIGFTPGSGRALIYATGGASYAKIDHGFATTNTANSFTEVDSDKWVWGWQAGGGVEFMLADNISLGAEYLYNRYNDNKYFVAVGPGTAPPTNPFLLNGGGTNLRPSNTRFEHHSLRATVSLRF